MRVKCDLCSDEFEISEGDLKEIKDSGLMLLCETCFKIGMMIGAMAD